MVRAERCGSVLLRLIGPALGKALERKAADLVLWLALRQQVGENFTHHRRKLEPVSRARRGNNNMRIAGQGVDNEIAIGRNSVKAGRGFDPTPVGIGEMIGERRSNQVLVSDRNRLLVSGWIDCFVAVVMLGDLDESVTVEREAIVHAMPTFHEKDREVFRPE